MTKASFTRLLDLEKAGEKLRKGEKGEEADQRVSSGWSSLIIEKLWLFVVLISPLPFYLLIAGLTINDSCIQQYHPIPFLFLIGLFSTIELIHFTLFSPPKSYGSHSHVQYEIVDFEKPEDIEFPKAGSNRNYIFVHCILNMASLWVFTRMLLEVFNSEIPPAYSEFYTWTILILAVATNGLICLFYQMRLWMNNYNNATLLKSIGLLAVTISSFLFNEFCSCTSNFYYIAASIALLATFLHLRFAYSFKNPPRWICLLTIKHLRALLRNWYLWMILLICAVWGSLFTLVVMTSNNGACSSTFGYAVLSCTGSITIGFVVKLFHHCCNGRVVQNNTI